MTAANGLADMCSLLGSSTIPFVSLVVVPIPATVSTAVDEFLAECSVGNGNVPVLRVVITGEDPTVCSNWLTHRIDGGVRLLIDPRLWRALASTLSAWICFLPTLRKGLQHRIPVIEVEVVDESLPWNL